MHYRDGFTQDGDSYIAFHEADPGDSGRPGPHITKCRKCFDEFETRFGSTWCSMCLQDLCAEGHAEYAYDADREDSDCDGEAAQ